MELNLNYPCMININKIYKQLNQAFNYFLNQEEGYENFFDIAEDINSLIINSSFSLRNLSIEGDLNIHSVNVAILCGKIGYYLDLNDDEILDLILGGLLHDIGKPFIKSRIINKTEKLTKFEMITVNKHEDIGRDIICLFSDDPIIINMIGNHHKFIKVLSEPLLLKDVEVRNSYLFTLICSIADITDAILSKRSYKPCLPIDVARNDLYNKGILDIDDIYKYIGIA